MLQPYTHSDKTVTIKPIETFYAGRRFRSRLEARWAVLLDKLGIRWMYEHQGFATEHGAYLPDFWLPELNTFLEVKAQKPSTEEWAKLKSVVNAHNAFGAVGLSLGDREPLIPCYPNDDQGVRLYPWPAELPRSKDAFLHSLHEMKTDEYGNIVCPACGSNYVHAEDPILLKEDYPHKHVNLRGPITCIPMWSELCWHRWELVVAFHKGNTFVTACMPHDGNLTPLEAALAERDAQHAVNAALSARFEHGETP